MRAAPDYLPAETGGSPRDVARPAMSTTNFTLDDVKDVDAITIIQGKEASGKFRIHALALGSTMVLDPCT